MKKVILISVMLLTAVNAFSKCAYTGLSFWPAGQTVNKNSIFVIDGQQLSQKIVSELGTVYPVYLKSDQQKIKLTVQEILVGQYGLTQAILKPETTLSPGQEYELIIENLENSERLVCKYNPAGEREKIKWTVVNRLDNAAPAWTDSPKFKNSSFTVAGCGPIIFANFSFSASDKSEFLIKTTVKNISTGKETSYYLKAEENLIAVGHGMCSGAFNFKDGENFEVEFSLFDASGNLSKSKGEKIKFKQPALKIPG
ncbi:hypothetical protein SAMN05443549_103289 [Flavobacterium fluvii]|uniref:Uncharacterized protein n=1 Tax=Flavobacterium fluvii TaxID=468056 RepID=A0A1M5IYD0_9FLAO|nr:hypothetical protein [Flavobacterium fluvii]SHG33271.1 hypothetical protein SAMN05443549_103289 [Flavobacterium fluvii]